MLFRSVSQSRYDGTLLSKSGFTQSFTEHGIIIGLANIRADLNYQQGIRRMWSRRSRYDFYFPAFANLGEQAVFSKEIYCTGDPAGGWAIGSLADYFGLPTVG